MSTLKLLRYPLIYLLLSWLLVGALYHSLLPWLIDTGRDLRMYHSGWLIEAGLVALLAWLCLVVFLRPWFALLLSVCVYLFFLAVNAVKIHHLATPVLPVDFTQLDDLFRTWSLFVTFLPYLLAVIAGFSLLIWLGLRHSQARASLRRRRWLLAAPLLGLLAALWLNNTAVSLQLRDLGIYYKKNSNLMVRGLKYGFATNFTQALMFSSALQEPPGYSREAIDAIIDRHGLLPENTPPTEPRYDNIVVLMVESWIDPEMFNIRLNRDPIPNFHRMRRQMDGRVLSPVYGGKSINAEFELMTGMSNRFTPVESIAYREFVTRPIPSLPRTLKRHGYETSVIQVVKMSGFGYAKVYDHIAVDRRISVVGERLRQVDPTGRWASAEQLGEEIMALTDRQARSFVFVFPNSTHSPWTMADYPESDLRVISPQYEQPQADYVSGYFNALNHVDQTLGTLLDHYSNSDESTLILMLGDHQPALAFHHIELAARAMSEVETTEEKFSVPAAIWSNHPLPAGRFNLSMNFLPSLLLQLNGIQPRGWLQFNDQLRQRLGMISLLVRDEAGALYEEPPAALQPLIDDYELLQYDLLGGEGRLMQRLHNDP